MDIVLEINDENLEERIAIITEGRDYKFISYTKSKKLVLRIEEVEECS